MFARLAGPDRRFEGMVIKLTLSDVERFMVLDRSNACEYGLSSGFDGKVV